VFPSTSEACLRDLARAIGWLTVLDTHFAQGSQNSMSAYQWWSSSRLSGRSHGCTRITPCLPLRVHQLPIAKGRARDEYVKGIACSLTKVWSVIQALWAQFKPDTSVVDTDTWTMSKMGSPISPLDVVLNGSQSMHAVDDEGIIVEGLGLHRSWEQLQIRQDPHACHQGSLR